MFSLCKEMSLGTKSFADPIHRCDLRRKFGGDSIGRWCRLYLGISGQLSGVPFVDELGEKRAMSDSSVVTFVRLSTR